MMRMITINKKITDSMHELEVREANQAHESRGREVLEDLLNWCKILFARRFYLCSCWLRGCGVKILYTK